MSSDDDEFLEASLTALSASPAETALDALGWWESLTELDDDITRSAVLSFFRAQGRLLADSAAVGGLIASVYLTEVGAAPGSAIAAIARRSTRSGHVLVLVGELAGRSVLVDQPGAGARLVPAEDVVLHPIDIPGRLTLHEVELEPSAGDVISEDVAAGVRRRGLELGRIAVSMEMLGAAEGALALALEHAQTREQFGRPIGTFQAVRHHLALAVADCEAIAAATTWGSTLDDSVPPDFDEITKALSGRNARLACERSLQVLGAIGFTAEHDHHHYHSRVLALDGLLGSSVELKRQIAQRVRTDPQRAFLTRRALAGSGSVS